MFSHTQFYRKEKKMQLSKKIIWVLGGFFFMAAGMLVFENVALAKNYTRSCKAKYSVNPTSFRGTSWTFEFTGKGTIGYYNPNEARRRARRNIDECIDTHWRRYTASGRPRECTEANQIYSYPVGSLISDISRNICRLNPGHSSISVSITVGYSGKEGCYLDNNSWGRVITRNLLITCPGAEFEPNTDRPGSDIRSLNLPRPDPNLCREACVGESRCRAWTYVRPGVQGPSARCWLKHSVPPARRNTNCTSGVLTELH